MVLSSLSPSILPCDCASHGYTSQLQIHPFACSVIRGVGLINISPLTASTINFSVEDTGGTQEKEGDFSSWFWCAPLVVLAEFLQSGWRFVVMAPQQAARVTCSCWSLVYSQGQLMSFHRHLAHWWLKSIPPHTQAASRKLSRRSTCWLSRKLMTSTFCPPQQLSGECLWHPSR